MQARREWQTLRWALLLLSSPPFSLKNRVTGSFYAASVLFVAPSLIPGTGQGLFTSQRLPKDSWLCEYLGTRLSLR
ncbi:putative histone lysine methyltransferase, SET [Toxoplasma gondii VEG]|uniref:Histone lysine methyltransferase, SET n=1 Tax=Toxoplasma gondii (strain ATCC 50861 / VEG) TaxID=432359 RepID=V4ZDV6_TOXGV|nr:putative histone lysine methyltransferase, SET [Toxoplasma gondii VEG]